MEFPKSEDYNLIDYGLNVHILKSTWYADDNYSSRKISGDKAPSKRFLIMDSYRNTTNKTQGFWRISINTSAEFLGNTNWAQPAGRHDGKVNMLYLNFHVEKNGWLTRKTPSVTHRFSFPAEPSQNRNGNISTGSPIPGDLRNPRQQSNLCNTRGRKFLFFFISGIDFFPGIGYN